MSSLHLYTIICIVVIIPFFGFSQVISATAVAVFIREPGSVPAYVLVLVRTITIITKQASVTILVAIAVPHLALLPDGGLEVLEHLLGEAGGLDGGVEAAGAAAGEGVAGVAEGGARLVADEVEAPREEAPDARHVPVEVHLGVRVVHRHHLREVDDDGRGRQPSFLLAALVGAVIVVIVIVIVIVVVAVTVIDVVVGLVLPQQDVELVEVAVDQAVAGQAQDHGDELGVEGGRVADGADLAQRDGALDELHEHRVAALGERLGHAEALAAERAHEGELALGREPGQVQPGAAVALVAAAVAAAAAALVVAVGADGAEGDAAEAVDLEDALAAGVVGDGHDVALLADADARADGVDLAALRVRAQRQVVEPPVRQPVALVPGLAAAGPPAVPRPRHEPRLGQRRDRPPRRPRPAPQPRDPLDQRRRHDLVVLAARLHLRHGVGVRVGVIVIITRGGRREGKEGKGRKAEGLFGGGLYMCGVGAWGLHRFGKTYCCQDSPVVGSEMPHGLRVELHDYNLLPWRSSTRFEMIWIVK